jgi:hypothetical protein
MRLLGVERIPHEPIQMQCEKSKFFAALIRQGSVENCAAVRCGAPSILFERVSCAF